MMMSPHALILVITALGAGYVARPAPPQPSLVLHKNGTREYHRPWCAIVRDGRDVLALTRGQAEARGLTSHGACEKDPGAAGGTSGAGTASGGSAAPIFVYTDTSKYYHRERCTKAEGALTRVALERAGKTLWPCPACRPPVRKKSESPAVPKRW